MHNMKNSAFPIDFGRDGFRDVDIAFARLLQRLAPDDAPAVALAALLVSRAAGEGHVCIDLQRWAGEVLPSRKAPGDLTRCPSTASWLAQLRASELVGTTAGNQPLVCDRQGRVYLQRLYQHEQDLASRLRRMASGDVPLPRGDRLARLREALARYFPPEPADAAGRNAPDWQRMAAVVALCKRLCIISGAPGTGKTTTVAKIIGLLMESAGPAGLQVRVCAPTGKAAARLSDALARASRTLACPSEVAAGLASLESGTIHRLLRVQPGGKGFYFSEQNPLPADVVVVDEASMVDLVLMSRLVRAVPEGARLIILGDKDQLASVEAGAVFGDLCRGVSRAGYTCRMRERIAGLTALPAERATDASSGSGPLGDCRVVLKQNFRFDARRGIGALTRAVNRGDGEQVKRIFAAAGAGAIRWVKGGSRAAFDKVLAARVLKGYETYFESADPAQALERFGSFRILCALAAGPFGAARINQKAADLLQQARRIRRGQTWYTGRPVMITRNDYRLGLFNGDTGLAWPDTDGRLRVWFHGEGGGLKALSPQRLPAHQTVFAMTVHKSQGSEFDAVLLVLPDRDAPVLTRELVYTGCSRARRHLDLAAGEAILERALARTVQRTSGLADALGEA